MARLDGAKIQEAMARRGWSWAWASTRLQVGEPTLRRAVRGEIPRRIDALWRILDGLGLAAQDVVIEKDE